MDREQYERGESLRVYASSSHGLLEDLESVIANAVGEASDHEPTTVVGRVDVDALEAHEGAIKRVDLYEPHPDRPAPRVPVRPRVRDLDPVRIGPKQVAIVRIVPAHDPIAVRMVAVAGLALAVGFLLFLLAL